MAGANGLERAWALCEAQRPAQEGRFAPLRCRSHHGQWHWLRQFDTRDSPRSQRISYPTRLAGGVELVFRCQVLLAKK